jgi:hypothetical protein
MASLSWVQAGLLLFASACAGNGEPVAATGPDHPDCSFESLVTCWTLSGRYPPPREPVTQPPNERAPEEPPVLAKGD